MCDKEVITQEIIFNEIKNNIYSSIKTQALERNGIIFGGMVRDTIIVNHYRNLYINHLKETKKKFVNRKFWDASHHPETGLRTLVSNDIDICFQYSFDSEEFIKDLELIFHDQKISKVMKNVSSKYGDFVNIQTFIITVNVGKIPFTTKGHNFDIAIDIAVPKNPSYTPPFENLDMLCNGFIETRYGIVFSRNTGTYIDNLPELQKKQKESYIIQDMLELKTRFCMQNTKFDSELGYYSSCVQRIFKLIKQKHQWTIENLPFKIEKSIDSKDECTICLMNINDSETKAIVLSVEKKIECCKMHTMCFMEYLTHQLKSACDNIEDDSNSFQLRCPMRTHLDLLKCSF